MSTAAQLIDEAQRHGVRLLIRAGKIVVAPPGVLPPELKSRLRQHAPEIRALLTQLAAGRAAWTSRSTPDARRPLIPPAIRTLIEAIESEAVAKGWPKELLWGADFWGCPRGLASVIDIDDEIV
jgi:hypothetical protein